jgi:hypothetical protein
LVSNVIFFDTSNFENSCLVNKFSLDHLLEISLPLLFTSIKIFLQLYFPHRQTAIQFQTPPLSASNFLPTGAAKHNLTVSRTLIFLFWYQKSEEGSLSHIKKKMQILQDKRVATCQVVQKIQRIFYTPKHGFFIRKCNLRPGS